MLNRLRPGTPADLFKDCFSGRVIRVANAHFDQLVVFQTPVDFREDRRGQSGFADQHHWIERVRPRFQLAPPGRG